MKRNAYLERRKQLQVARDTVVMQWSHQMVYDALTLVLNDKAIMGKDVFGKDRLNRLGAALNVKISEIIPGLSSQVNASYVRAQVDRELQRICGDDFEPWEQRYPDWDDRGI